MSQDGDGGTGDNDDGLGEGGGTDTGGTNPGGNDSGADASGGEAATLAEMFNGVFSPDLTEQIYQLLRQLGVASAPQHQAQAIQGLQSWLQRSRGSTAALLPELLPQIRQIRGQMAEAFTQVSKRLGPMGGKQIEREQGKVLASGGQKFSDLLTGAQQKGTSGLMQFLQSMRPALLNQLPQLTSSTNEQPLDLAAIGQALAGGAGMYGKLYDAWNVPSIASLNPGYNPPSSPYVSGLNSGYGDFVTFGA